MVTQKIHSKTLSKPWLTPHIQKLINKKNKLFSMKNKIKQIKIEPNIKLPKRMWKNY